jgi:chloramphenicol O-acetyltransferase type A
MRVIDQSDWPRRQHFNMFRQWSSPHFNMCANVDITAFKPAVRESGASFTICLVYLITRAANAIPEFRQRIRGDQVVEHEIVHPSCTILVEHDLFSFCSFTYTEDFPKFAAHAQDQIDLVQRDPWIKNDSDNDAQLFMTAIPWASFTSFMHPLNHPVDSIPRFAWGKYFQEGDQIKMPLSVQGHHALMDGLHIGHYFQLIQEHLHNPEFI